ncbi:MAG: hypothetical protein ACRCYY_01835 [Trueperaceae bacterium]
MIRFLLALYFCIALAACSTPTSQPDNQTLPLPSDGTPVAGVNRVGFVSVGQVTSAGVPIRSASGSFIGYSTGIAAPSQSDYTAKDSCIVTVESSSTDPDIPTEEQLVSLDAGAALTLKTNEGVFANLAKDLTLGAYINDPLVELPTFPEGLLLDVPGTAEAEDGFPAFSNVPVPPVSAEFNFNASSDLNDISKATTFSWIGSAASTSIIGFLGEGLNQENKKVFYVCTAIDDGSFEFPADTQTAFDGAGFTTGILSSATRNGYIVQVQGDAALTVNSSNTIVFSTSLEPEEEQVPEVPKNPELPEPENPTSPEEPGTP